MKHSKKAGNFSKVIWIPIVLFSAGVIFFGWKIADYLIDAQKSQNFWNELQETAAVIPESGETGQGMDLSHWDWETGDGIPALLDFDRISAISEDAAAWIYAPGTILNYAVAQGKDNEYYLRHLLNGAYANCGTPFIDYRSSSDFFDWNTVIYGHNMNNGTMFAELVNYGDQAFYEEHPVMYLYVPGKRYTLELVAGYPAAADDRVYSVPITREQRDELLAYALERTTFDSGIAAGGEDRLVTLSTCSDANGDARYVVIARIAE